MAHPTGRRLVDTFVRGQSAAAEGAGPDLMERAGGWCHLPSLTRQWQQRNQRSTSELAVADPSVVGGCLLRYWSHQLQGCGTGLQLLSAKAAQAVQAGPTPQPTLATSAVQEGWTLSVEQQGEGWAVLLGGLRVELGHDELAIMVL